MGIAQRDLEFYRVNRLRFVDYATAIVGDRDRGEDIVQEAFIRWNAASADRVLDEPVGYFHRIVRNLALDWLRRRSGEQRIFDANAAVEAVAENRSSPEEELLHKDELQILMKAMAELPPRTRQALEMHRFEGYRLREIAVRLGVSVTQAHALVYEGLSHCRERLYRDDPD